MKCFDQECKDTGRFNAGHLPPPIHDLEKSFSLANQLSKFVCSSSVSLINVLDDEFQYTISKRGPWNVSDTLPREESICQHTLSDDKLLIIEDTKADPRTRNLNYLDEQSIRFYAGIPLKKSNGEVFGTLCVLHNEPNELVEEAIEAFENLADQLQDVIDRSTGADTIHSLKKKLAEKELLFSEIHHRIKNNLADICGILQIKRFETDDPAIHDVLSETESRITAAIKLHEALYESKDMVRINLKDYLERLMGIINQISQHEDSAISYRIVMDEVYLAFHQMLPIGLIINELATNSVQHAFNGRSEGLLSIEVHENENGLVRLVFRDNGNGFEAERYHSEMKELSGKGTLGFKLIDLLARQLQAKMELHNEEGVRFVFEFMKESNLQVNTSLN